MAQLAAAAADKVAQRKMTDYMASSGGAGELPSGPCHPAAQEQGQSPRQAQGLPTNPSEDSEMEASQVQDKAPTTAETISKLLKEARQQQHPGAAFQAVQVHQDADRQEQGPSESGKASATEEDKEGWQVWTNRRNRKVGSDLEQEARQERCKTPFQLPGISAEERRGYYPSTNRRHIASANRSSRPVTAKLTEQQWSWFKVGACLGCGANHQAKDCKALSSAESRALVRAALSTPPDMRPGGDDRRAPKKPPAGAPRPGTSGAGPSRVAAAAAQTSGTPSASKRDREAETSGLTPEAKKAKMFSDAVRASLTLFVREKDGGPLTKERFQALKTSFTYYVEDMLAKNKDPPICAGRWQESRTVVRIPMASEEDVLWMRCFLDKAYLVQSEEEFRKSKNKIYVAFLRDRLEPEFTNMRQDKLANFVRYYRRQVKISSLFELRMAAKTARGKAIHLVMDEEAEAIFIREGCKIPFAASGWISFEERQTYVARIKAQERERLRPKASELEKGKAIQGVAQMDLGTVEVVDLAEDSPDKGEKKKVSTEDKEKQEALQMKENEERLRKRLLENVKDGCLDLETAEQEMLERTGRSLKEPAQEQRQTRRTTSSSSWSEEVDHMKKLDESVVPATISEGEGADDGDDRDHAQFELRQEQNAQVQSCGLRPGGGGS